ncbi:uncharacterized protein LOC119373774 [Rhipicephalus sanguineus]|uniref:uncharacterized protein LOC119373774 n=1 Tax=Rhipicephalus sanguineus TaxID=34632 RepID=UPI0018931DC1|nr:uncharacterized protein LOC119373774 [Rhipicephalus sanguineus]
MKLNTGVVLLVAYTCVVLGTTQVKSEDQCDFSGVNAERMITNILRKLPSSYTDPDMRPGEIFLGITLGAPVLKGANIFKLYGPVSTYCRDDDRLVKVDIVADYPMEFSAPWKICSGKEGVVGIHGTARVTVTFEVANATAQDEANTERKLVLDGELMPVNARVNAVYLRGAGEILQNVVGASRIFLPGISAEVWESTMKFVLRKMLKEATEHS